nr:HDIG domain-containing protein [Lachnospiraceae bacterium]
MKEKQEKRTRTTEVVSIKEIAISFVIAMLPSVCLFLYCFMKNQLDAAFLANEIRLMLFAVVFLFVLLMAISKKGFFYENNSHLGRFSVMYLIGILLVVIQSFIPDKLWLFLPLAVVLVLFSGLQVGICAYVILLYLQMMLTGSDPAVFLAYICVGMIGILLFSHLDIEFLFGVPLFASLILVFATILSMEYAVCGYLHFDSFLYAAINVFVSFLLLTFALKYLSYQVLHKDRDKYQEINDPEYRLLTELKKTSQRSYYHAVHTAYFSEKIARRIGADEMLAKAGGYYHKIGKMRGNNNLKNALEIASEYNFPPQLVQLLKEYGGKNTVLRSKEAAIVILADAMVSSVMFLFEKDRNAKLDYEQIVSVVFKKQMDSGILDHCDLTMDQMRQIRTMFTEETLYYDFLR